MTVETALVVGVGVMAKDIAVLLARHGISVELLGRSRERSQQGAADARRAATRRGAEPELIRGAGEHAASAADVIVEAVTESLAVKRGVLATVSAQARPATLVATTTSGIPIAQLADAVVQRDRFVGLHFYNPATSIRGVEVVAGPDTSEATVASASALLERLDKRALRVADGPGFVGTRLILRYLNEAAAVIATGESPATVDAVASECLAMPMGPCALMDLIGLDVVATSLESLAAAYGDDFAPARAITERVAQGALGRKTGLGFHRYD